MWQFELLPHFILCNNYSFLLNHYFFFCWKETGLTVGCESLQRNRQQILSSKKYNFNLTCLKLSDNYKKSFADTIWLAKIISDSVADFNRGFIVATKTSNMFQYKEDLF